VRGSVGLRARAGDVTRATLSPHSPLSSLTPSPPVPLIQAELAALNHFILDTLWTFPGQFQPLPHRFQSTNSVYFSRFLVRNSNRGVKFSEPPSTSSRIVRVLELTRTVHARRTTQPRNKQTFQQTGNKRTNVSFLQRLPRAWPTLNGVGDGLCRAGVRGAKGSAAALAFLRICRG